MNMTINELAKHLEDQLRYLQRLGNRSDAEVIVEVTIGNKVIELPVCDVALRNRGTRHVALTTQ